MLYTTIDIFLGMQNSKKQIGKKNNRYKEGDPFLVSQHTTEVKVKIGRVSGDFFRGWLDVFLFFLS